MDQPKLITVPNPPDTEESKSYYYVYGEWVRLLERPRVAAAPDAPVGGAIRQKIEMNEAISVHPAIFANLVQEQRPGYTVRAWSRISKPLYDWLTNIQRLKNEAALALVSNDNGNAETPSQDKA